METKKPSPQELEREKQEIYTGPLPKAVPTYNSVSETKPAE